MGDRKSIYLSDQTAIHLGIDDQDNLSGRIATMAMRYRGILRDEAPALALNEWSLICDILNGSVIDSAGTSDPVNYLWADIAEAGKLDGQAAKWAVETEALSAKIRGLRYVQQVAIVEIVAAFWRHPDVADKPLADILTACGAKITT